MLEVSDLDKKNYEIIRKNVSYFIKKISLKYDSKEKKILDIAPEIHKGAKEHFKLGKVYTLDINKKSGADYILDLCKNNSKELDSDLFDIVICTEVLEHCENPFNAVNEISRVLKKNGIVGVSVPFNFRIHGPLPDNWRFTIHGLKNLFSSMKILEIETIESPDRNLMPIHYTLIAEKL